MLTKLTLAQLALMMLLVGVVEGQELDRRALARAMFYEPIIASAAQRHELDPRLLWTIAYLESRFRPEAISHKNGTACARGLMQFVPATARQYDLRNPHDAREAIDAAARYVQDLQERFGGNTELVLAAYNAGEGTVEAFRSGRRIVLASGKVINPGGIRTGGVPPYDETQDYVARGRLIYKSIVREGLFASSRSESLKGTRNEGSKPGLVSINEDSIYTLSLRDQGTSQSAQQRKTKRSHQTQSLYSN